jgi:hypothetical protein
MVLSVRAQRSRAEDMDSSPAIDQCSYAQPPNPTAPPGRRPSAFPLHSITKLSFCLLGILVKHCAHVVLEEANAHAA